MSFQFWNSAFINWTMLSISILCVGSFLNVVIHRLPIQLGLVKTPSACKKITLSFPSSHCPNCRRILLLRHKIPLVSYIFLKRRCAYCHNSISISYPIVEVLSLVLVIPFFIKDGISLFSFSCALVTWALLILSLIDINLLIIPDELSLGLMWFGLGINTLFSPFTSIDKAVLGTIVAYLGMKLIGSLFKIWTSREGLGQGDWKLFAAIGACLGIEKIGSVILIASCAGLCSNTIYCLWKNKKINTPLPFGPYLSIGCWYEMLNTHYNGTSTSIF